jgi:DNA-binding CsgD family transcriptional regulator
MKQVTEIVAAYQRGASIAEIARKLRSSTRVVRRMLVGASVEIEKGRRRNQGKWFTAAQREYALTAWGTNRTLREIATYLHTDRKTVAKLLRALGENTSAHSPTTRGSPHSRYKTGRTRTAHGYALVLVPPDSPFLCMRNHKKQHYVLEHRLVMALHVGRPLLPSETVHHINGDRFDNRIENLQLIAGKHVAGAAFRCKDCGSENVAATPIDPGPPTVRTSKVPLGWAVE